jgi:hypothetical protein
MHRPLDPLCHLQQSPWLSVVEHMLPGGTVHAQLQPSMLQESRSHP